MYNKIIAGVPLWQFQQLADEEGVAHYISGREGEWRNGANMILNLSYGVGDNPSHVRQNRAIVAKAMGVSEGKLIFPSQTHSNNVRVVNDTSTKETLMETDALVTDIPGICISILVADCVPILVLDTKRKVVAAIHSGWRGTVGKILSNTLSLMHEHFASQMNDVRVCIGPSIGPSGYEVGEEVVEAAHKAFPDYADRVLVPSKQKGKALFNLWEANKLQAVALGIPESQIEIAGICTYTNHDRFFSARRAFNEGRFAAGIMLTRS